MVDLWVWKADVSWVGAADPPDVHEDFAKLLCPALLMKGRPHEMLGYLGRIPRAIMVQRTRTSIGVTIDTRGCGRVYVALCCGTRPDAHLCRETEMKKMHESVLV
jgi:hypothetical protein